MERLGGWKRDFKVPQAILRWLGTMAVVVGYFCRTDQVATAVSVAKGSHLGLWWTYSVCSAFYEHPSELSNFEEFRDFIFRLPEFSIWGTTARALVVAIVTTFFWPKNKIAVQALRSSRRSREATNQINNSDVSDISEQPAA